MELYVYRSQTDVTPLERPKGDPFHLGEVEIVLAGTVPIPYTLRFPTNSDLSLIFIQISYREIGTAF